MNININDIGKSIDCIYKDRELTRKINCHWHMEYEIGLTSRAIETTWNNGMYVDTDTACVIIHRPYTFHSTVSRDKRDNIKRYTLMFPTEAVKAVPEMLTGFDKLLSTNTLLIQLSDIEYNDLSSEFDRLSDSVNRSSERILRLAIILENITALRTDTNSIRQSARHLYIQKVMAYIDENLSNKLTVEGIAGKFYVSQTKLSNDFKSYTLTTVCQYILKSRLNKAKSMLKTDIPLSDITYQCGFGSESYFIYIFRTVYGITPGEYRKNAAEKTS